MHFSTTAVMTASFSSLRRRGSTMLGDGDGSKYCWLRKIHKEMHECMAKYTEYENKTRKYKQVFDSGELRFCCGRNGNILSVFSQKHTRKTCDSCGKYKESRRYKENAAKFTDSEAKSHKMQAIGLGKLCANSTGQILSVFPKPISFFTSAYRS